MTPSRLSGRLYGSGLQPLIALSSPFLGRCPHTYTQVVTGSYKGVRLSALTTGVWPKRVPEGRGENSTALQCRGSFIGALTSPIGTADISSWIQSSTGL